MLETVWYKLLSNFGSRRALGSLERIQAKEAIWRDWQRSRGRYGWKPTGDNVRQFLELVYGFEWEPSTNQDARLSKDQLDQIFKSVTPDLIARSLSE